MEGNLIDILTANPAFAGNVTLEVKAQDLREFAALLMKQAPAPQAKTEPPARRKPLSSKQACALLQISMPTLMKYRRKGLFVGRVLDGKVYYWEDEILAAMENKKG